MASLQTWSDEELCRFCIPRHWEENLESAGCIATPLVSAVILFVWYLPWREDASFLEGAAVWVVETLLLQCGLHVIAGWRSCRHKAELARRYSQRVFNVYRRSARRELKKKAARKIYLLQGRDVEGKQCVFVKATLEAAEPASGRLTVRIAPDFQTTNFQYLSSGDLVNQERELTPKEATALLAAHDWNAGGRLYSALKSKNQDEGEKGFACSVATLEPSRESIATCDLLSKTVSKEDPTALQMTLQMLHLAETLTDHPLVTHWEMPGEKKAPFRLDMSEESAKHFFEQDGKPDWVILFHGSALPHGGHYAIRAILSEADQCWGRLWSIDRAYDRFDRRDPRSTKKYHEQELSAAESRSLLDSLHSITPRAEPNLKSFVYDGLPCNMIVLHRSPPEVTRAECNLAGLTEDQAREPLVKLMHLLLELRQESGAKPAVYGTCDTTGNIHIDEI